MYKYVISVGAALLVMAIAASVMAPRRGGRWKIGSSLSVSGGTKSDRRIDTSTPGSTATRPQAPLTEIANEKPLPRPAPPATTPDWRVLLEAVDCKVSPWTGGPCSKKCGGGVQINARKVLTLAAGGGKPCPSLSEQRSCNTQECVRSRTTRLGPKGLLEVLHDGNWGTVCSGSWDDGFGTNGPRNAKVVCASLAMEGGTFRTVGKSVRSSGLPIHIDDVNCKGTEDEISKCSHGGWGKHSCKHSEDVAVLCTGCEMWDCNCQGLSDAYGTRPGNFSAAPDVAQTWWTANECQTLPTPKPTPHPLPILAPILAQQKVVSNNVQKPLPSPESKHKMAPKDAPKPLPSPKPRSSPRPHINLIISPFGSTSCPSGASAIIEVEDCEAAAEQSKEPFTGVVSLSQFPSGCMKVGKEFYFNRHADNNGNAVVCVVCQAIGTRPAQTAPQLEGAPSVLPNATGVAIKPARAVVPAKPMGPPPVHAKEPPAQQEAPHPGSQPAWKTSDGPAPAPPTSPLNGSAPVQIAPQPAEVFTTKFVNQPAQLVVPAPVQPDPAPGEPATSKASAQANKPPAQQEGPAKEALLPGSQPAVVPKTSDWLASSQNGSTSAETALQPEGASSAKLVNKPERMVPAKRVEPTQPVVPSSTKQDLAPKEDQPSNTVPSRKDIPVSEDSAPVQTVPTKGVVLTQRGEPASVKQESVPKEDQPSNTVLSRKYVPVSVDSKGSPKEVRQ